MAVILYILFKKPRQLNNYFHHYCYYLLRIALYQLQRQLWPQMPLDENELVVRHHLGESQVMVATVVVQLRLMTLWLAHKVLTILLEYFCMKKRSIGKLIKFMIGTDSCTRLQKSKRLLRVSQRTIMSKSML